MFGYLNLGDPTKIGNNEAQEATNIKIDNGYLEYKKYETVTSGFRRVQDLDNSQIYLSSTMDPTATKAEAASNADGWLLRERTTSTGNIIDILGTPDPSILRDFNYATKPLISVVVSAGNPVPIGKYEYALTIYNPDTNEESAGPVWTLTKTAANQGVQFADLPGIVNGANSNSGLQAADRANAYKNKLNAEYRIYRRSPGSSEFLRVPFATITGYNDNAGPFVDIYPEEQLGVACGNVWVTGADWPVKYPYDLVSHGGGAWHLFTVHNNRLWFRRNFPRTVTASWPWPVIRGASVLYYSKVGNYGEFPALNYFAFGSEIVAIHSVDEALYVFCLDNVFVIYGDDENDFVVKQLTDTNIGCAGCYASLAASKAVFFLAADKSDKGNKCDGVFVLQGSSIKKISTPIETLFPAYKVGEMTPTGVSVLKERPYYWTSFLEDRFVVFTVNTGTIATPVLKNIVYDMAAGGFCLSDAVTKFYYRSKEFGRPGAWDDMKRAFIRGVGQFTIELYYDGVKADEISFNISGSIPQTYDFTVPSYRANYFSFRIIGETNAKVYEFGRLE
jgi:hypothetical protein